MGNKTKTLRDFARHQDKCPVAGHERALFTTAARPKCRCGLDALLSEPQPNLSAAVQALEQIANSMGDVRKVGRFSPGVDPLRLVASWEEHLREALSHLPRQKEKE